MSSTLETVFEEVYGRVDYTCKASRDVRVLTLSYVEEIAAHADIFPDKIHCWCEFFAFAGEVPESLIGGLIGRRPDDLVDGFADLPKPRAKAWVNESTIEWICNLKGVVVVGLVQAS